MKKLWLLAVLYVVTWDVSESHPTSCCGDRNYSVDPYTKQRVSDGCEVWAILCWSAPVISHFRQNFSTKDEAQTFINKAPKSQLMGGGVSVGNFKLEEQ